MAGEIVSSNTSSDQEKFLAARLLQRSMLRLVCASVLDKLEQPKGTGLTAYFVRYQRMNVPLVTLDEAGTPSNSTFSLGTADVTLDQWGDVLTISDVSELTTKHPLVQQCIELLADNAQRVIDREVQLVWLAGTNIQYFDGSRASRTEIQSSDKVSNAVLHQARVTMADAGAPPRGGPAGGVILGTAAGSTDVAGTAVRDGVGSSGAASLMQGQAYVAICGPQVSADIQAESASLGTWASVAMYNNAKALYNGEIGTWLGIRIVETNFIPKFTLLGDSTVANASGSDFGTDTPVVTAVNGGGTLNSGNTYYYKVTRKKLDRGFEEDISIAHSTAADATGGDDDSFTFNFSSLTAGYVYNLYFDSVVDGGTGVDADLGLHTENIAVGTTVTVTTEATTGDSPPPSIDSSSGPDAVHPIYIHGAESGNWVGLQSLQMYITPAGSTDSDPLAQRRSMGYKFLGKAMIRDQTRMLRVEVASTYA